MAKKSQVPPAPEMTALPMAGGDSPLVIDLPDGQKLVVGNLAAGSVIEVATWRGTGRPDSRTSRLMLGMSSGASQEKTADAAPYDEKKSSATSTATAIGVVNGLLSKIKTAAQVKKKSAAEKRESAPLIEKVTPAAKSSDSAEVDDWLNSILEKSAKKSAAQKSAENSVEKPAVEKPAAKKPVKKAVTKSAPKKKPVAKKKSTGRAR
jgi:Rod binding domain-containing protein